MSSLGSISIVVIRKEQKPARNPLKSDQQSDHQSDTSSDSSSDSDENEPTLPDDDSIENLAPKETIQPVTLEQKSVDINYPKNLIFIFFQRKSKTPIHSSQSDKFN